MLKGKRILITSGPTRMPLDAMRFISNRSTWRFGTLLAKEALKRGAKVTFIYGVGSQTPKAPPKRRRTPFMYPRRNQPKGSVYLTVTFIAFQIRCRHSRHGSFGFSA